MRGLEYLDDEDDNDDGDVFEFTMPERTVPEDYAGEIEAWEEHNEPYGPYDYVPISEHYPTTERTQTMPDMIPTESSNIAAIGFEADEHEEGEDPSSGTLTVEFRNGRTYEYTDVEFDTWCEFKSVAEGGGGSVGVFFASRIRNGGYPYVQV